MIYLLIEVNTKPQPATDPIDPVVDQPVELGIVIPLRRYEQNRRPAISDDYVYSHENDFNISQAKDPTLLVEQYFVRKVIID